MAGFLSRGAATSKKATGWLRDSLLPSPTAIFGMDRRSMAFFRVGLALTILGDIINRSTDLRTHYTDYGIYPRKLPLGSFWNDKYLCFHMLSGGMVGTGIVFFIHAVFAFGLLIGFYTKTCQFVCWLFHMSLMERFHFVLHSGDVYMACQIFFSMFLPLASCFSIDKTFYKTSYDAAGASHAISTKPLDDDDNKSLRPPRGVGNSGSGLGSGTKGKSTMVVCAGTIAVTCQMMFLYMFSVYFKTGKPWHEEGTAVYYALQLDYFRMPLGDLFLYLHFHGMSWILPLFAQFTLVWEFWGPLTVVCPLFTQPMRFVAVLGFIVLHMGFGLCLRLGEFVWICIVVFFALIPQGIWDRGVFPYLRRRRSRVGMKLWYNPLVSPWPGRVAKLAGGFFLLPETTVVPMHRAVPRGSFVAVSAGDSSESERFAVSDMLASDWLVVTLGDGTRHHNYAGLVAIMRESPLLWPFTRLADNGIARRFAGRTADALWKPSKSEGIEEEIDRLLGHSSSGAAVVADYLPKRKAKTYFQIFYHYVRKVFRNVLPLMMLWFCFTNNMSSTHPGSDLASASPQWLVRMGYAFHISQNWRMFSPQPPSASGWHIIEAALENGTRVELFKNEGLWKWEGNYPVTLDPPAPFHKSYSSHRWYKYWENGYNGQRSGENLVRLNFGQWICREWNRRHEGPARVKQFWVHWVLEAHHLDGSRTRRPHQTLWHHQCY